MPQTFRQLRGLQRKTLNAIRTPLTKDYSTRVTENEVAGFIKPNDRLTSLERLEIYNRQYWFRLLDCLWDDHPGMRAVLGEEKFQKLSIAYLNKYPSRHFSLRNLGSRLEKFLSEEPAWARPYSELCLDLARFEWAQVVAFDEKQEEILKPDDLAGRDPGKLRLKLQPHITLLELNYPLDDFVIAVKRQALRGDASNAVEGHRDKHRSKRVSRPRRQRVFIAVYRQNNMIYYKRMEAGEYKIICALRDGKTVEQACKSAKGEKVAKWFKDWALLGWFCKP